MIKQEALLNIGGKVIDIGRRIMVGAVEGAGDRRISEFSAELDHAAEMLISLRYVASGMSASGQDAERLEAKSASPTAEGGDAHA